MCKTRAAEITVIFKADAKKIWDIIINNTNDYSWKSDIKKVEVITPGKQWIEYHSKKNFTKLTVSDKSEFNSFIINKEGSIYTGHVTGYFYPLENGGTKAVFTEYVLIKNPLLRLMSYLFFNLKKRQKNYVKDLKTKLGEV